MGKTKLPVDVRKNIKRALLRSLLVPTLLVIFYFAAPYWLGSKIRLVMIEALNVNSKLSAEEKAGWRDKIEKLDFRQACFNPPPELEKLHDSLVRNGLVARFERLQWGLILSLVLEAGLLAAVWAVFSLNRKARESQEALIRSFQSGWKVSVAAALINVVLLVPLLTYGLYEFVLLLSNGSLPVLLAALVLGGLFALLRCATILLKKVPLEFKEPMSREVTPEETPELWQAVRLAARRLCTPPPDRIVIGLQLNFYVTELAVRTDNGRTTGRTLYLSYPLMKQLSVEEVQAIIGHELGHFIGDDTRLTREFYPLRLKIHATMIALARSRWVARSSFEFLNFFGWCFGETEREMSRRRELLADQIAAKLTSPRIFANALVRFQVAVEAFKRGLADAVKKQAENPMDIPLQAIVQEKLAGDTAFWEQLFEQKLPHPLDTHPSLLVRLGALGQNMKAEDARSIALAESETAYAKWLSACDGLFTGLAHQAQTAIGKLRLVNADYQTPEGRALLDEHFPAKTWQFRQSTLWLMMVVLSVLWAGWVAAATFIPVMAVHCILGLIALLQTWGMVVLWRRYRRAELMLNADGVRFSSWSHPLRFKEIQHTTIQRSGSKIILIFRLKARQPRMDKYALIRLSRKVVRLPLTEYNEKPGVIAQTILRYMTRQEASAATGDKANKPQIVHYN